MIIECNSCKKKFTVPDGAITAKGRLVQCSSCGNQWTQYPLSKSLKQTSPKSNIKKQSKPKKKVKTIDTYSEEYLQKKHGIKIIDPSSLQTKSSKNRAKSVKIKKTDVGFGFYNYLITSIIILLFLFGLLNLTKDIIVYNYPFLENYINHLYETLNNISLIISDIISSY